MHNPALRVFGLALLFAVVLSTGAAQTFNCTGSSATFTSPTAGVYHIVANGAQGGASTNLGGAPGGLGARDGGDFNLTAGEMLTIAVGCAGKTDHVGGGGGGSFVATGSTPLLIAAGGGGAGGSLVAGGPGQTTPAGVNGGGPAGGTGGANGSGGIGGTGGCCNGGGGAGFISPGGNGSGVNSGAGGQSFALGLAGGAAGPLAGNGGFGGGGGGGIHAGGGGGGYSGGGGGDGLGYGGGGGGSFISNAAGNTLSSPGANSGDGSVTIVPLGPVTEPTFAKAFSPAVIAVGGSTTLTFTINNTNSFGLTGIAFSDMLPGGLVVSTPSVITGVCGGTVTAGAGSSTISLAMGSLAANSSCTIAVNVTATMAGSITNMTGPISASPSGVGGTAMAGIAVVVPPTFSKAFGASSIPVGGSTSLTFTITNPNTTSLSGVMFSDMLPVGLVVSTPSVVNGMCGGTVTAIAGSNSVSLTGGTLVAGTSCTITVNVTTTMLGSFTNITGPISAAVAGVGATATAPIFVTTASLDIPFQSKIFPNLAAGDSVINIGNTGAVGNLCVNVYVFSPDEQEVACCTCFVTPNGVVTTSARQMISKTLTPAVPTAVTVKLVATDGTGGAASCNAAMPGAITPGLIAFGTNIHAASVGGSNTTGTFAVTETPFIPATLSAAELSRVTTLCGFIQSNGTGFGVCPGCTTGAGGATRE